MIRLTLARKTWRSLEGSFPRFHHQRARTRQSLKIIQKSSNHTIPYLSWTWCWQGQPPCHQEEERDCSLAGRAGALISTLQLQVCEIFSYLQWILTDVRILLCQLVFEDSMERPVKDNQHVLCQETCSYNNFMQENTMQDVIPNSNEPPLVSRRPMVHSTSRVKLSSKWRGREEGVDLKKGRSVGHCFWNGRVIKTCLHYPFDTRLKATAMDCD